MTDKWLELSPDWFSWYLLVLTIVSCWLSIWSYRRVRPELPPSFRLLLISLRSVVLILIGSLAVHPVIRSSVSMNAYPSVTVWIDQSRSMNNWWTDATRTDVISRIQDLASDSVNLSVRFFGSSVSELPDTTASMTSQTRFSPVVKSAGNGLNLVVTDGRFDDQEWFFTEPVGHWDAWMVGDTTQPAGFMLQPLSREQMTGFTGDTLRLPLNVTWRSVPSDSVRVMWTGGATGASDWIVSESGAGNQLIRIPVVSQNPGTVVVQVRLEGSSAIRSQGETIRIRIRERYRDVWILAHEPQPFIGFIHRQALAAGAKNAGIFYDTRELTPSRFSSAPPAGFTGLIIAVNYPSVETRTISGFRSLTEKNPVLLVSSVPLISGALPDWVPPFRIIPEPFNRKPWMPAPVEGRTGLLSGWTPEEIGRMPPHQTALMAVPGVRGESAQLNIAGTILDFPVAWSGTGLPKRAWVAAGAWDDWDRLEA